jgi:DNA-binding NarL/FixJ family response regulator
MVTAALYGNSLGLSTIAASIEAHPGLRVVRVAATDEGAAHLRAAHPDVVVFDVATAHPDVVGLCAHQPGVLLIGVDLLAHRALVFGGQSSRAVTLDDVLSVITSQVVEGAPDVREG